MELTVVFPESLEDILKITDSDLVDLGQALGYCLLSDGSNAPGPRTALNSRGL